jgi:ribosomal protein S18 acetylase RimI-like enzyme
MKINQDVFVQQGIMDCQIEQLIEFSQTDIDVQKYTSDKSRFQDRASFSQWLQQGRIIYTLINTNNNLLGIIWFGQKDPPVKISANFTFAIRIYGSARGQGLSQEFMKIAFKDLRLNHQKSHITGFWLETSVDNFAAIHTYEKFGFKQFEKRNNKTIMVLNNVNI